MLVTTHEKLSVTCLNQEQHEKTCGYWYLLQSNHSPYTAFRTREALNFFLDLHKLKLAAPLPTRTGVHGYVVAYGKTRTRMHGSPEDLPKTGRRVLHLQNGDHTLGIVTEDDEGPIVHFVGPNGNRVVFDHAMARAHVDAGHKGPMTALIEAA